MTEIKHPENFKIKQKIKQARFSKDFKYILDSDSQKVELDDPRIVFVNTCARNTYGKRLVIDLYEKYNRRIRISEDTDYKILQYGKKICSGRECVVTVAVVGSVLKDINENRADNEITIYLAPIDQHGPCQNGAWPVLWNSFAKRLNLKNIIYNAAPKYSNNYLGLNQDLVAFENINFIIGHALTEARNALQCVAEEKAMALNKFEDLTNILFKNIKEGKKTLNTGLIQWAKEIAKIPLSATVEETTKVLIFGGINLLFDHYPIENFFLDKGIIVKVVDIAEFLSLLLAESTIRFGFKKGIFTPKEQFEENSLDFSELNEVDRREARRVRRTQNTINFLNSQCKSYRKIIGKSGLLFDSHVDIVELLEEGNKYVSSNSFTETPAITGRFMQSVKEGTYDGLINLGTFNCQPAMNSQAIIRPLANKSDIPYAAIDCEGPWISTNQRRLLETIAIQAKRIREKKNNSLKNR
jgi:predicted nucleotide-binding protein (sugar kinase/HSP70/actin superfamily)